MSEIKICYLILTFLAGCLFAHIADAIYLFQASTAGVIEIDHKVYKFVDLNPVGKP